MFLLACILGGILFIWCFVLVWFKLQGKAVGCAAGFAFVRDEERRKKDALQYESDTSHNTDDRIMWENSLIPETHSSRQQDETAVDENYSVDLGLSPVSPVNGDEYNVDEKVSPDYSRHEQKVQACFFSFGLVTLVCIPLIIIFAFKPLIDATAKSDVFVSESRYVIQETAAALVNISEASESSLNATKGMVLDIHKLCPNFSSTVVKAELGVDLVSMVTFLDINFTSLAQQVFGNVSNMNGYLQYCNAILSVVENSYKETENYMWLVPTILLTLSLTTAVVVAGSCFSRTRQSTQRFQNFVSYGMLPLLIALSLSCWLVAAGSALATAVGWDACLSGLSLGSPNETALAVLRAENVDSNNIFYEIISTYTSGCHGYDPAEFILTLEKQVQNVSDFIEQSLTKVDAVGQDNLEQFCGNVDELGKFLSGSRDLQKFLTSIRKDLDSAANSLSCRRINKIYVEAVNKSVCTDLTTAASWGFIFFLCIGISTMAMITLRASWRYEIREENIYDESEVAENMVVDEHEEYLVHISKFKYEWEEYEGLGAVLSDPPIHDGSTDSIEHSSSTESQVANGNAIATSTDFPDIDGIEMQANENDEVVFDSLRTPPAMFDSPGSPRCVSLNDAPSPEIEQPPSMRRFFALPSPSVFNQHTRNGILPVVQERTSREFLFQTSRQQESAAISLQHSKSLKSKYTIMPSPTNFCRAPSSSRSLHRPYLTNALSCRQPVDVENLKKELDEIGRSKLIGTLGHSISPERTRPSPIYTSLGSVHFTVTDDKPSTLVKQQVHLFSKKRPSRPLTPTRNQPATLKELATKLDSPPREQTFQ